MFIYKALDLFTIVKGCLSCCPQAPAACGVIIVPKDSPLWPGLCPFAGDSLPWDTNKYLIYSFFLWHNWSISEAPMHQRFKKNTFKFRIKPKKIALPLEICSSFSEKLKKLQRITSAFQRKLMRKLLLNYLLHNLKNDKCFLWVLSYETKLKYP